MTQDAHIEHVLLRDHEAGGIERFLSAVGEAKLDREEPPFLSVDERHALNEEGRILDIYHLLVSTEDYGVSAIRMREYAPCEERSDSWMHRSRAMQPLAALGETNWKMLNL